MKIAFLLFPLLAGCVAFAETKTDPLQHLKLPPGFRVGIFAEKLGRPRMLATDAEGRVYVTRPKQGDVVMLSDSDGDGRSDKITTAVRLGSVHGIVIREGKLWLATVHEVWSAELLKGGKVGELKKVLEKLPHGGNHPNRTIGFGPDGMLYVSVGSTCNSCEEASAESATILRAKPDGTRREIFARGLRNTIGFAWHPVTRELFGMDHGTDLLGDDLPPEELNLIQHGKHYGWPYCYGDRIPDPVFNRAPKGKNPQTYCRETEGAVLATQAHSAPIAFLFYTGAQFPSDYRGDAFVAMHGSWNRSIPVGYKLVRIRFQNGKPTRFEDFLTGFMKEPAVASSQSGRPAGLAVAKDGALLFSDDDRGVIYRVSYTERSPKSLRSKEYLPGPITKRRIAMPR